MTSHYGDDVHPVEVALREKEEKEKSNEDVHANDNVQHTNGTSTS